MPKRGYTAPTQTKKNLVQIQAEEKFTDVKNTAQTLPYYKSLCNDIQYLRKILVTWSISHQGYHLIPNQRSILCDYVRCFYEYTQFDQFDSQFSLISSFDVNLTGLRDSDLILKSFNIFKKCKWPVRFDQKFVSKVSQCSTNQIKYILSFVMLLADGKFISKSSQSQMKYGYARPLQTKSFPYNRYFTVKIFREKNILVHIGVQKIPIVSRNNVIKRYEFNNYIAFLDILGDQMVQNPKKLEERMKLFYEKIMEDVAKRDHSDQIQIDAVKLSKNLRYFFYDAVNPYTEQRQIFQSVFTGSQTYSPLPFKPYYVSALENSTMIFDKQIKRWTTRDYLDKVERKKLNEYQRKINEELVKRFVDFQSAKTLVQLLTKIPNFKVKLTQQEKDVIGQNGNVMVIGRSGTGKTTCAVLRLFSIEMLFKIRLSLYKKKFSQQISNTRCSANDIDQTLGLHCIFLTASPVLTNQIQRYYKKLTENIKQELEKKKKKVQQQRKRKQMEEKTIKQEENQNDNSVQIQQNTQNSSSFKKPEDQPEQMIQKEEEQIQVPEMMERVKSKQVVEQQSEMNHQLKDIQLKQNVENQEFNQDQEDFDKIKQEFEEKIKKYHSLEDLQQKDYPGFFTVKSYIMMIDGVLQKPFFIRSKQSNSVLDQQSKAAWHNERKGVMMIENYYKNQESQNIEVNQKLIDEIQQQINYSDEQQLEHQYMRQIQLRENKQKQQLTKKLLEKKKKTQQMSFQVDYEYFLTYFWPHVNRRFYSSRNITPQLVWTEIYSTIKGSAGSHLYSGQYLPQKVYISQTTNVFLTKQQKLDIYQTFCQYQRWKIKNGGYDIMDAVNYILNFMRFRGWNGPEIHYVMIDQVQDLPHAIIYLLSKTASYGVFYSGDTAQTIAKGVGFRFCDLKSLFDQKRFDASLVLKKPIVKHLTVNFRSHNNILQLANSIVTCLQILFPKTIDKLAKQRSDLDGPKPMILAENDEEMLFYVLCGQQKKQNQDLVNGMKKPPLQFGCDQVIIVRDQQSKQKVPGMLQHALCLTIYEAKGLQFNDVILFNFFTECKHPEKWNLLKYLKVIDYQISKQQYDRNLTRHKEEQKVVKPLNEGQQAMNNQQIFQEQVDVQCIVDEKNNTLKIKKIVSDVKKIMKDINDYAELCSDLKLFYTAITRPRKTLIIYDEDPTCRKLIEKMWENLGIIQIVTKSLIEAQLISDKTSQSSNTNIFKRVISATDTNEWKKQGLKMYSRGYFEQAMKCFQKSGNQQLFKKSKANLLADKATKLLIEVQSERNSLKQGYMGYRNLNTSELSKLKKKLKHNESKSHVQFNLSAQTFEELKMFKQAGQCYFSGKKFQNAKNCFVLANMMKQAAQSLQMMELYKQAAELYDKDGQYLKVIECLDMINQWEEILKVIKKYQQKMSQIQKSSLLKKYASLSLEALVYEVEFENQNGVQTKETQSKPQNQRIQIIQQKESDEQQDVDSDDNEENSEQQALKKQIEQQVDPERAAEESYKKKKNPIIIDEDNSNSKQKSLQNVNSNMLQTVYQKNKSQNCLLESVYQKIDQKLQQREQQQSESFSDLNQTSKDETKNKQNEEKAEKPKQIIDQRMLETVHDKEDDQSFSDLNQSKSPQEAIKQQQRVEVNNSKDNQSSFSDLNVSQDFSDLNTKYQKQLDPDIESIRSLADPEDPWIKSAISQINAKSQYSILDESQNYNLNVKIIKTKGNIFIQDQIMQKIIRIVSIINQSSTTFLQQFKGYQSLITVNKSQNQQNIIQSNEITDFEDIDSETINIILDTLESFKLYKLCLFVCNRYHLPEKAGRYLISILMKYSTNCQANTIIQSGLLAPSTQRKAELEKGILGSIAVHSVLQNVNSEFLKIKISSKQSQNKQKYTLGNYFVQGLILQGFYKKTVFMVNPEEALHILDNFCDYDLFREFSKNKSFIKLGDSCEGQKINDIFLPLMPNSKNHAQMKFSLLSLRDIIYKYQVVQKLDMISYRYYKQFGLYDKINFLKGLKIPGYLPFTKNIIGQSQCQSQNLYLFLDRQLPLTYSILTKGNELQTADAVLGLLCILHNARLQKQLFHRCTLKSFLEFYRCIKYLKNIIFKLDGCNSLNIIRTVLIFYQCKLIQNYPSMSFIGSGYCFLNRTSNMANQLIQESRVNPQLFAYFFEQDFNFIMVKISSVMKIIKNKFIHRLSRFVKDRTQLRRFNNKILHDDYQLHNDELVVIDAMNQALLSLVKKDKKTKKQIQVKKSEISNNIKPSFDYKTHGKVEHAYIINEYPLSDQQQDGYMDKKIPYAKQKYVLASFKQQLSYLSEQMLSVFNKKSKQAKQAATGNELYCCNLNSYYREYVQKIGGYNLYDAVQFKKFKRVDLYADNVLSVIDSLPLIDKHVYIAEILNLLMIEYLRVTEGGKQLNIKMHTSHLKFLENMNVLECIGRNSRPLGEKQIYNEFHSDDLHSIISNGKKFAFSYDNKFTGQLNGKQIQSLICSYLELLEQQEKSQYIDLTKICIMYIINIKPTTSNIVLYNKLRKIIISCAAAWDLPYYKDLAKSKNYEDFISIREEVIQKRQLTHTVRIQSTADINQVIDQSERDYQIQTKIINGRKKALNKIWSWWKKHKITQKIRLSKSIVNYYDNMIKNQDTATSSISEAYKSLNDFRMFQKLEDCNLTLNVPLLLKIQNTRQNLLKFYLKSIVTSSLDFHFMLITLRKLQTIKLQYISLCRQLESGIVERNISDELLNLTQTIADLNSNITTWMNDEKWLKDRNLSLKRKKVFQVKWMTRSLNQMKIIQKRAGLKKQHLLQLKKKMLKG